MEIKIDPELKALIPPLSKEEFEQLERNILEFGCLDSLKVWAVADIEEVILLDGHNRFAICCDHNVSYDTEIVPLIDKQAAIDWIIANQLGRRNLSAEQMLYLRGMQYQQEKQEVTNPDGIGGKSGKIVVDQNDPQQSSPSKNVEELEGVTMNQIDAESRESTASRLARQHGVSEGTIKRDAKYAEAVDAIANATSPQVRQQILSGDFKLTKSATVELAKLAKQNPAALPDVLKEIQQAPSKNAASAIVKRSTSKNEGTSVDKQTARLIDFNNVGEGINWLLGRFTIDEMSEWLSQNITNEETR